LTSADVGFTVRVQESATNAGGTGGPVASAQTAVIRPQGGSTPPVNTSAPELHGKPIVGSTLTSYTGMWTGSPAPVFAYEWARCLTTCTTIRGATGPTYVLQAADVGTKIRLTVRATNTAGVASAVTRMLGPVVAPTRKSLAAALLAHSFLPHGRASDESAMLRHNGYSVSFKAPTPGTLVLTLVPAAGRPRGRSGSGKRLTPIVLARVVVVFHTSRQATVRIVLTRQGRALLTRANRLALRVRATFISSDGLSASVTGTFLAQRR
jgi:hypothetical protein